MTQILCVDDDQALVALLKKRLEREGFEVEAAHTVKQAKELFVPSKYSCILIDYHLPDGEGLDLIKFFIKTEELANCILLTGKGDEKTAVDAFLHGVSNYLVKDVEGAFFDLLPTIIRESITKKALIREKIEQDENKDNFIAIMSHELKTPVSAFTGFCDCLMNGVYGKLEPKQLEIIQKMLDASNYLNSIMTNMLSVMMLERNKIQLTKKEYPIKESVDFCLSVVESLAKQKQIAISYQSNEMDTKIYADQDKINQILINLLKNAIVYTEKGSITVIHRTSENGVEISVKDTGLGIAEEELKTIFNPYIQAKITKERNLGGTGLGLTIAKQLVELHDGQISVVSQKNQGSEFKIQLPIAKKTL